LLRSSQTRLLVALRSTGELGSAVLRLVLTRQVCEIYRDASAFGNSFQ